LPRKKQNYKPFEIYIEANGNGIDIFEFSRNRKVKLMKMPPFMSLKEFLSEVRLLEVKLGINLNKNKKRKVEFL